MINNAPFLKADGTPYHFKIQQAALAVLRKLPGCADPKCLACPHNRELVQDFFTVVADGTL